MVSWRRSHLHCPTRGVLLFLLLARLGFHGGRRSQFGNQLFGGRAGAGGTKTCHALLLAIVPRPDVHSALPYELFWSFVSLVLPVAYEYAKQTSLSPLDEGSRPLATTIGKGCLRIFASCSSPVE